MTPTVSRSASESVDDPNCTYLTFYFEPQLTNEVEPPNHYRHGQFHPVVVGNIIRPGDSPLGRLPDAPTGYRVLHKLGHGGEATVWLAQGLELPDRLVALKIFAAAKSHSGEREALALTSCMPTRNSNASGSEHVLSLLDAFIIHGPNGTHHVHITDVVMPLNRTVLKRTAASVKKDMARDLVRGLAYIHRCGFVHGDLHLGNIGCAMPPGFAAAEAFEVLQYLSTYNTMMLLPETPTQQMASLPGYLLYPCNLFRCFEAYDGLKADMRLNVQIYDFGNARRPGEDDGTDVCYALPPPELVFASCAHEKLGIPPTLQSDIWSLGATIFQIFTGKRFYDTGFRSDYRLIEMARLDGVIPPAWREYWETDAILSATNDSITPENADAGWTRLRDTFMRSHPDFSCADADGLVSLLRRMLALDPAARPSAEELLAHPWIADSSSGSASMDESSDNAKWPYALSHNCLQTGGWARQQAVTDMPIATRLAGVNMRLEEGAIRELHWHNASEWAYVLRGTAQISTVTAEGQNYVANVTEGSLWYFPSGQPHSMLATGDHADGVEFLLVFDNGEFNENDTFLLTDWLAHVPKEVLAKNFHMSEAAFDRIPGQELYIFPGPVPSDNQQAPQSPYGTTPEPYTFDFASMEPTQYPGGTVKVADSRNFKVAKTIAVAEVTVLPGAMRELHWHPSDDEWTFFIEGNARITLFAASGNARTFDYQGGDIAYIPGSYGHYIENTGTSTLRFLEVLKTDVFRDISLNQWLALTPPELVKAHLQLSDESISQLSKVKPVIVAPQFQ